VDAATWFKVASWGSKSKAIHWKLSGIAKTVGEYAISEWERSPSAKQAKCSSPACLVRGPESSFAAAAVRSHIAPSIKLNAGLLKSVRQRRKIRESEAASDLSAERTAITTSLIEGRNFLARLTSRQEISRAARKAQVLRCR
jgi:hypothetical protein